MTYTTSLDLEVSDDKEIFSERELKRMFTKLLKEENIQVSNLELIDAND